ncbi:hypothetical protein BC940DRAFT_363346 [Gongronella butleri]|nr:hypothetical protein BC940DRAFT_363346 [Gongronella butleri]
MEFIPTLADIQIILYNAIPDQVMRLAQLCDTPSDLLIDRNRKHALDDVTAAIEQGVPFKRLPKLPPLDIRQVLIELDFFYRYIQTLKRWCAAALQTSDHKSQPSNEFLLGKVIRQSIKLGEDCGLQLSNEINAFLDSPQHDDMDDPHSILHTVQMRYYLREMVCICGMCCQPARELYKLKKRR